MNTNERYERWLKGFQKDSIEDAMNYAVQVAGFRPVKIQAVRAVPKINIPDRYIINEGATILFWQDGTKTIVKRNKEDEHNPRLAFLTAYFQKNSGLSKNKANKYLDSLEEKKTIVKKSKMCIIINTGEFYSSYHRFVEDYFPKYQNNWKMKDYSYKKDRLYKLIGIRSHHDSKKIKLALIQDIDTKQVFIFGVEGLKFVNKEV